MQSFARFFSIYFLLGSCLPGTNFGELTKLGELQDHYQLHVAEAVRFGKEYTLRMFIDDHYISPDEHTQEGHEEQHQKLPLQSMSTSLLICMEMDSVTEPEFLVPGERLMFETLGFSADCLSSLLRPPIR